MTVTIESTITISDVEGLDGELEIPFRPDEWIDPVVNGNVLRYAALDESGGTEYEFPEGVRFIQGNSQYIHYCNDVEEWLEEVHEDSNLEVFPVGVYEHGLISYSLAGESIHSGDQWDYCIGACIAVPKDFADPKEAARGILDEYTSWCNGSVYLLVEVPLDDPDNYDVVGGFIGSKHAEEAVKEGY